jgi:type IV pilus assembly protein PilB
MIGFLDILIKKGVMNHYQADDVLQKSAEMNNNIDGALANIKIPSEIVRTAKSEFFGIPEKPLPGGLAPINALHIIPQDTAQNYRVVPLELHEGILDVGVLDPGNIEVKNALQFISSKANIPFQVFVVSYDDYKRVIEAYGGYTTSTGVSGSNGEKTDVTQFQDDVLDVSSLEQEAETAVSPDGKTLVEDAPATRTVGVMIKNAVDGGASDIHIEHSGAEVRVRFRVDGVLHTTLRVSRDMHSALVAKIKSLANLKLDEKRKPQDGRFMAQISGRKIDFRVSTFPTFFGEKVVLRILDSGKGIRKLGDLGMVEKHINMVQKAITKPYGMILITGPTGAGKSTTLYSMLEEIDREELNVVSLEDPVEYNIAGMSQSQVRPEIGYTFAAGLRSILRQDPDVIMVGEIRDKETAELAINAALTGHLVLATLHTNSAVGAVPRLIDMGIDPYLISPTLIMVIGQRMVKRLIPNTSKQIPIVDSYAEMIKHEFEDIPMEFLENIEMGGTLHEVPDDKNIPSTRGRIGCFEILYVDKGLEEIILKNPTEIAMRDYVKTKQGMVSMRQDAMIKAMKGLLPLSEANGL